MPANAASTSGKIAPKPNLKPVQPVKAAAASKPSAGVLAARAKAGRNILAHSTVPNTCSGDIAPDTVYPCGTPSSTGTDTFTVTLSSAHDLLVFDVLNTGFNGGMLPVSITPAGGTASARSLRSDTRGSPARSTRPQECLRVRTAGRSASSRRARMTT